MKDRFGNQLFKQYGKIKVLKKHIGHIITIRWEDAPDEDCLLIGKAGSTFSYLQKNGDFGQLDAMNQVIKIKKKIW